MEVELFQDAVDQVQLIAILVDPIERVASGLGRQRRDVQDLAVGRYGGDPGGDANADVVELAQLLYHGIDFLGTRGLRIENGFGIVENYEHLI